MSPTTSTNNLFLFLVSEARNKGSHCKCIKCIDVQLYRWILGLMQLNISILDKI